MFNDVLFNVKLLNQAIYDWFSYNVKDSSSDEKLKLFISIYLYNIVLWYITVF